MSGIDFRDYSISIYKVHVLWIIRWYKCTLYGPLTCLWLSFVDQKSEMVTIARQISIKENNFHQNQKYD
jgi:hypothetical protein